jgi:hypothetical protein
MLPNQVSNLSSQVLTFFIEPGKTFIVNTAGQSFYFLDCSAEVFVSIPGTGRMPHTNGTGRNVQQTSYFDRIEIENKQTYRVYIRLYVGNTDGYIDNRLNLVNEKGIVERITKAIGWDGSSIAGNEHVDFAGLFQYPLIHRKALLVTNEDLSLKVELRDSNDNRLAIVFPETCILFPSSDFIRVANPNPGSIAVSISELVYF